MEKELNKKQDAFTNFLTREIAVKEYVELLKKDDETFGDALKMSIEEQYSRLKAIRLSLQNHEGTVQQNRNLQQELQNKEKTIKKLKERPFFPYPMNDGGMTDFGEFYLVSHAWFSFLNTTQQVGIVEVEYKTPDKSRKIYVGIASGDPTAECFNQSVLSIAKYGQKIKDSSDEF